MEDLIRIVLYLVIFLIFLVVLFAILDRFVLLDLAGITLKTNAINSWNITHFIT